MENPEPFKWTIDKAYKSKLKIEDAKIICDDAQKAFDDTIETSIRILDRNSSLLQLVAGLLIGLVAFSISRWEKSASFDALLITSIAGIAYFFFLGLFFIFPNIKPTVYTLPGTQPKKLFTDQIFATSDEKRCIYLYMIKITNLQVGIESNRDINNRRWEFYKRSLNFLFYSPIVLVAIYLAATFIAK